jgi:hypothetical protein
VQLMSMGLLAEMVTRTYHEAQDKPIYVIREQLDAPAPASPVGGEMASVPAEHATRLGAE